MTEPAKATPATPATPASPATTPATPAAAPKADEGQDLLTSAGKDKAGDQPDYKLTFPEGVTYNQEMLKQFNVIGKKHNLTQEGAQELLNLNLQYSQAQQQQVEEDYKALRAQWAEDTKKAFGANYEKEASFVAKARDAFVHPELLTLLQETGLVNNLEVFRMLNRIGKAISEDVAVPAGAAKPDLSNLPPEERLRLGIQAEMKAK